MKKVSKGLCLVLALIMSVAAVGCGGTPAASADIIGKDTTVVSPETELIYFGTHDYTAPETDDKWLVKNGTTEYKLVVPADTVEASDAEYHLMREEFLLFFARATGITLRVITDAELIQKEHNENQHYISLDKTTLIKSLEAQGKGIDYSLNEVDYSGGKIVTVDNNIYIVGYTNRGTLNTVYTFLDITFNWECYSANTIVMDEGLENLKLRNYQVTDIPDVEYQPTSGYEKAKFVNVEFSDWGYQYDHPTEGGYYYGQRVRTFAAESLGATEIFDGAPEDIDADEYLQLERPGGHNSTGVVNQKKWASIHPEWYSTDGTQLCYTARGNKEKYDLLVDYVARMIERQLIEFPTAQYPHKRSCDITIQDNNFFCECEGTTVIEDGKEVHYPGCAEMTAKYKNSGVVIRFFNDVAEAVEAWMLKEGNEAYFRDNLEIRFYAYLSCESPPAKLNEDGEWVPIDESVVMHKYTCVKYANINTDFQQSLFAEDNKWAQDVFDGWKAVADGRIGYFMYNYNTFCNGYFYDGFDHYDTKGLNYYLAGGRSYYYSENIHGDVPAEWGALISYVNAKLCYDSTLDSGKLIDNWFNACFGNVAGIMKEMLRMMRVWNHAQTVKYGFYKKFSIYNQVSTTFDWDINVIMSWYNKTLEALDAIEYLKEVDIEEYDRIKYNIELEAVCPMFVIYSQGLTISEAQDKEFKTRIRENLEKYPEYRYVKFINRKPIFVWLDNN